MAALIAAVAVAVLHIGIDLNHRQTVGDALEAETLARRRPFDETLHDVLSARSSSLILTAWVGVDEELVSSKGMRRK